MESTSPSAANQARDNLHKINHFVVLMLKNRSFDQMPGYLELEGHDVDGVKPAEDKPLTNLYNGETYELRKAKRTALTTAENPCCDGWCVSKQLSKGNGGFVEFGTVSPRAAACRPSSTQASSLWPNSSWTSTPGRSSRGKTPQSFQRKACRS